MPDTSTEVAIATTTLGSAASTITFSSISGSYTDLRLVLVGNTASGASDYGINMIFNSDSTTVYSATEIYGSGSSAASSRVTGQAFISLISLYGIKSSPPSLWTADIFSYAGSTFKTVLINGNSDYNGSGSVNNRVGLWRSTSAITSLSLSIPSAGINFAAGTTATLYGIL